MPMRNVTLTNQEALQKSADSLIMILCDKISDYRNCTGQQPDIAFVGLQEAQILKFIRTLPHSFSFAWSPLEHVIKFNGAVPSLIKIMGLQVIVVPCQSLIEVISQELIDEEVLGVIDLKRRAHETKRVD